MFWFWTTVIIGLVALMVVLELKQPKIGSREQQYQNVKAGFEASQILSRWGVDEDLGPTIVTLLVWHELRERSVVTSPEVLTPKGIALGDQLLATGLRPTPREVNEAVVIVFMDKELYGPVSDVRDLIIHTLEEEYPIKPIEERNNDERT